MVNNNLLNEYTYITKYLSPRLKATNLATYHAMFYLSHVKTGRSQISVPWSGIGGFCGNERGDGVLTKNESIRTRTTQLVDLGCIEITRTRAGFNVFEVKKPSDIKFVREMIARDYAEITDIDRPKNINSYKDHNRRLKILTRDQFKCAYCLARLDEASFYVDHIIPRALGGTDFKNNLVSSCNSCNSSKSDRPHSELLLANYRANVIDRTEFESQTDYIEGILCSSDTGEP